MISSVSTFDVFNINNRNLFNITSSKDEEDKKNTDGFDSIMNLLYDAANDPDAIRNEFGKLEEITEKKDFSQRVKDFRDEYLTGLSEEDKKKIEEEIERYMKNHDVSTESGLSGLKDFVAGLLKKYGFKGDCDEMADTFINDLNTNNEKVKESPEEISNMVRNVYNEMKYRFHRI